jgi:hypothetical protein
MHQHSFASSTSSGETTLWSTTLSSVVSPQTQTTERETLALSFETSTSANVKVEDDEDDLSEDVDFAVGNTLKWLRSEEKEKDERNKRRAEEQAEEDKKRRATEGYRPAFVIDVDGIPLEVVETERRLAAAAADALMVKIILRTQRDEL